MSRTEPTPEELTVIDETVERALARNAAAVPESLREAYRCELRAALTDHWAARRLSQRLAARSVPGSSEERELGAAQPPNKAGHGT